MPANPIMERMRCLKIHAWLWFYPYTFLSVDCPFSVLREVEGESPVKLTGNLKGCWIQSNCCQDFCISWISCCNQKFSSRLSSWRRRIWQSIQRATRKSQPGKSDSLFLCELRAEKAWSIVPWPSPQCLFSKNLTSITSFSSSILLAVWFFPLWFLNLFFTLDCAWK